MRITVFAKTNSKEEKVQAVSKNEYRVFVNVQPEKGKANEKIIELLADFLDIPKTSIKLIRGQKSKIKVFETD
jgi:uncharacterized protein YggU (UPF0235/DUF167 family)